MPHPDSLADRFARLQAAARGEPNPPQAVRERRLQALGRLLLDNEQAIADAVRRDFGHRSPAETRLLEIFPSHEAVRHARRHLRRWMRPQARPVSLWFQPGRAEVRHQPLGAVGIIVPWNYPIFLAAAPLAAALAAGNRALVKMSEITPATAALFAELAGRYFADDELSVVEGDVTVARAFAALPFDHLLFTGSTAVGRQVMRAAADNLTPVTLELGGKSPAIIGPLPPGSPAFVRAVERIVIGKCLNAGQTCIAPDYVLLPAGQEEAFVQHAQRILGRCYPDIDRNADYSAIVDQRQYARLTAWVDEARTAGATIVDLLPGAVADPVRRHLPPLALLDAGDGLRVMQEEIFGPLLPIIAYRDLEQAIRYVNQRPRPLALYYFDGDRSNIERVLDATVSGGVTVNDTILHIAQEELPFGGVGPSGMGCYHGFAGFETFSVRKAVFRQSRLSAIGLFKPPYGALFDRLTRILLR
ncbi:MAG TPA: coniferyl aldehyde dehydrogenase [Candidatus Accumulibacter phosphatis]|nr:MAG: Coniferyl aldehyde dehydrogenase [Candidatus Accumulibacter sp. SK-11]HRQ96217.1 coniferyl aldehyde dehydrogenase [Candidatus Accumulibacter phosphatis]HRQ97052.1 coniferyl aldehyde dehydrogenase [Candidatus Accumulibacter phosphatis]